MCDVSACGSRSAHFSRQDEEDLRKEQTTSAILDKVRKDANVGGPSVEVRGDDATWRATKEEQQAIGLPGWLSIGHSAVEAAHLAEFHAVEKATAAGVGAGFGAGTVIGGAIGGFALGIHEWHEAYEKGEAQKVALAKDELHVAMLTQLELPQGFKTEKFAERAQAGQGFQSTVQKMETPFATIDKPLVAVMQHHADLGIRAARDFVESGASKEKFMAANPGIADAYKRDPAFHDGFDALVWTRDQKATPGLYKETIDKADARDCRYTQANVSYRL